MHPMAAPQPRQRTNLAGVLELSGAGVRVLGGAGLAAGEDRSGIERGYGPGQLKMGFISAAILFCLFNLVVEEQWGAGYNHWATLLTNILFAISIVYGIKSYRAHQKKYRAQMSQISQVPDQKAG